MSMSRFGSTVLVVLLPGFSLLRGIAEVCGNSAIQQIQNTIVLALVQLPAFRLAPNKRTV
jgi:hypothetical protein